MSNSKVNYHCISLLLICIHNMSLQSSVCDGQESGQWTFRDREYRIFFCSLDPND